MIKLRERFSLLSVIVIGFLMGAMFVAGGFAAYKFYFPRRWWQRMALVLNP